jgi:hypothetical protein
MGYSKNRFAKQRRFTKKVGVGQEGAYSKSRSSDVGDTVADGHAGQAEAV